MTRLLVPGLLLLLGVGCSTLSSLSGARTLEPGQAQVGLALSAQRGGSPLSYAGFPLPQAELVGRIGVSEDFDVGFRSYLIGAGFDARYRFYRGERVHLAVAPGLAGAWLPPFAGVGVGSVDLRAPVVGEVEISRLLSVSGGPQLILRDQWNSISTPELGRGTSARLDVFAGGGARIQMHPGRLVLGIAGDVYAQPVRFGGTSWSVGIDVGLRTRARAKGQQDPEGEGR